MVSKLIIVLLYEAFYVIKPSLYVHHQRFYQLIHKAPFTQLAQQGMSLEQMLNQCCYSSSFVKNAAGGKECQLVLTGNPDLASWIPKVHNLVERIQLFKPHLVDIWKLNKQRLDQCYQLRAFEADMVSVFQWIQESKHIFMYNYNQIGDSSATAISQQKNADAFNQVAAEAFKEIDRLVGLAGHFVSNNHYASKEISLDAHRLEKDRNAFVGALAERTRILALATKFYVKSEDFINSVPAWTDAIHGIDFTTTPSSELMDIKESLNQVFSNIKVFYNEVRQLSKSLMEILLTPPNTESGESWANDLDYSGCSDPVAAMSHRVMKDFEHLEAAYENKLNCITLVIAVEMFEKDVWAVVNWVDDHGEPFINKTTNIGKSLTRTKALIKKHEEFIKIAQSTRKNAHKVVQTGHDLLKSGVGDHNKISQHINFLQMKMRQFQEKVDYRTNLLQLAFKFYDNMKSINMWIGLLKEKLSDNAVPDTLDGVREAKDAFETERNATIDAMLDCRHDGEKLREELRQVAMENEPGSKFALPDVVNESMTGSERSDGGETSATKTSEASNHSRSKSTAGGFDQAGYRAVTDLISSLDEHKRDLDEAWNNRKVTLDLAEQLRWFELKCREINDTAIYWVAQLEEIKRLENATVAKMLSNSSEAVNATVQNAKEVLKMGQELYVYVHGNPGIQLIDPSLGMTTDDHVKQLWTCLKDNVERLQEADNQQRQQFRLQIEVNNFEDECKDALNWIRTAEEQLNQSPIRLRCLDDAVKLEEETRHFHASLQKQHQSILGVYRRAEIILSSMECMNAENNNEEMNHGEHRGNILINKLAKQIADDWGRLVSRVEYRNDLARTANNFFKTHSNLVETLESLQKDFSLEEDTSPEMPLEALRSALNKHSCCKDDFTKLCGFIRKLSEGFLAQLSRKVNHEPYSIDGHDDRASRSVVQQKMDSVLLSETNLLAAWDKRKKRLDNHLKFAELRRDCENVLKWLKNRRESYVNATTALISGSQPLTDEQLKLVITNHDTFRHEAYNQKLNVEELMLRFADLRNSQTPLGESNEKVPMLTSNQAANDISPASVSQINDLQKLCKKLYSTFRSFHKDTDTICAQIYRLLGSPPPWENLKSLMLECPAPDTPVGTAPFPSGSVTPGAVTPGDASSPSAVVAATPVVDSEKRRLERKREFVINELLETEKAFVRDLNLCISNYLETFRNTNLASSLVGKESNIFANIEQIYQFHSEIFLKELDGYRGRPEDVGHGFVRNAQMFKQLYVEYCKNMPESNRVILIPDAVTFFDSIKERRNLPLEIQSCLIKPVQRITKYSLLLKDLLGCCDFQSEIKEALELMRMVPQKANDTMHLSLLQNVPKELNLDSQGDLVLQETFQMWEPRQLIKKGRERHLFLFEYFILFAKVVKDASGQKYLYKAKFEVRNADFSITDHVDTDIRKFGLYFSRPYNDSNKYVLKAPSEECKNDWLVALRSAKRPELYLQKNLDMAAGTRRANNIQAGSVPPLSHLRGNTNNSSTLSSSDVNSVTSSSASNAVTSQSNRDSKISRDSQASTGDEREPSVHSNEYVDLTSIVGLPSPTSSHSSNPCFPPHSSLSNPKTSAAAFTDPQSYIPSSPSHFYMNTSNFSSFAPASNSSAVATAMQGSSSANSSSGQTNHQQGANTTGENCEKVSISSLSSSVGDKDDPNFDVHTANNTLNGNRASVETERSGANGDDEHAAGAEGDECGSASYRKDSISQEDDLLNVTNDAIGGMVDVSMGTGASAGGSMSGMAKRSNSIKKWLTSPVRKLSSHNTSSGNTNSNSPHQSQPYVSSQHTNNNSIPQSPTSSGNPAVVSKRSLLTAKLTNTPQIKAMYSQHYNDRKTRGECGEGGDIPGGETGSGAGLERAFGNCIIQESSEEACAPDSYNASANATLERDPSSMSQHSQLPPPMPELPPSSSFGLPHNTSPTGSSAMKNHRTASPNSPPTILSLEELMSKFEQKQPTTKRECMIFEVADTEAKYVASLAQVVEGYMAVTMSGSGSNSSTSTHTGADLSINSSQGAASANGGGGGGGGMTSGSSSCSSSNSISIPTDLADRLHIVWGNIRQIYEWHRNTLFPHLGAACYSNNLLDVANCFIRHERRFLMYSKYSINLPKADYILGEFDNFFSDVRKSLNLKMGLKDLLVEPVQRAMRYQLMLQGIVAHLEKHPEDLAEEEKGHMDRLRLSLNLMTKIPKEVNDMMQLGKLLDYDGKMYGSITAQGKLLLQASVRFHAEGSPNLNSSSNKKKDGKKYNISPTTSSTSAPVFSNYGGLEFTEQDSRQVFLFEQSMLVAEAEKSSATSTFIGSRYFFKNFIKGSSMNGVFVEGNDKSSTSGGDGGEQSTALQFRLECSDRNYEFLFENAQTCHLWATTITNLIMDRRDFAKALSKPIEFQKKQLLIGSHSSNATMTNSTTSSSTSSSHVNNPQSSGLPSANIAMT